MEAAAEKVCDQSAIPLLIFQLPPKQGRDVLEKAQDSPVYLYPADISARMVDTGCWGTIPVYTVMPKCDIPIQNVIFYIHSGGWVFGSFHTHEKLVRELAARTGSFRLTVAGDSAGMQWFGQQYAPCEMEREQITASGVPVWRLLPCGFRESSMILLC